MFEHINLKYALYSPSSVCIYIQNIIKEYNVIIYDNIKKLLYYVKIILYIYMNI